MDEMDRIADLGTALYPSQGPGAQLRARALAGATAPAAWPGRARQLLITGGAVFAAGVAVVAALATAPATGRGPATVRAAGVQTAAFTVRVNHDGSVTFTARDLVNPGAATKALNQAGITGRVINITGDCATGPINPGDVVGGSPLHKAVLGKHDASSSITVQSSDYPPGGGLLIAVKIHKADDIVSVVLGDWAYTDAAKIPACLRLDPGPAPSPGAS